jgi:hypothetical protein
LYLELQDGPSDQTLRYALVESTTEFVAEMSTRKALITNLLPNKEYEIWVEGNCGPNKLVVSTSLVQEDIITVSSHLYNHVTNYFRDPSGVGFTDFMANLDAVSIPEKTAFIQKFIFRGMPLPEEDINTLPTIPDGGREDSCFCNYIRTAQTALPARMETPTPGRITDASQPGSGPNYTHLGGDDDTRTWFWYNNKGAAKWHQMWTEGYGANGGIYYDKTVSSLDSSGMSAQKSYLRVAFLCMDGDKLPRACECEKSIKFWYRYDTRVTSVAELRSGINGDKSAQAQTEDIGLAYFLEEGNGSTFTPLRMVVARSAAQCNRQTNPAFWTTVAGFAGATTRLALSIIAATSTPGDSVYSQLDLQQIGNAAQSFFNQSATLLNTPYYNPATCDNEDIVIKSMEGYHTAALKPNTPVVMGINSYNKLYSGGMRAWHSYSRVNSDFHLAGFINANAFDDTPRHCCSPLVGLWIVGSCDGPLSTQNLMLLVRDILWTTPLTGLGSTLPYEYGWISTPSSRSDCNRIIINNGSGIGYRDLSSNTDSSPQDYIASVSIWDVSGKMLGQVQPKQYSTYLEMKELVEQQFNVAPGIYFLHMISSGGATRVQKIVLH